MDVKEQIIESIKRGEIEEALDQSLKYYEGIKEKKPIYKILLKLKSDYSSARSDYNKNLISNDKYQERISIISDKLINLSDEDYVTKLLKIIFLKRMGMILTVSLFLLLAFFTTEFFFPVKGIKFKPPFIEKEDLIFDFHKFDYEKKTYLFSVFVLDKTMLSLGPATIKENGVDLPYNVEYSNLQNSMDVFYKPKVKMTFTGRGNFQLVFELLDKNEAVEERALLDQIDFRFEDNEGASFNSWRHGLHLPKVRAYLYFALVIDLIFVGIIYFIIYLRTVKS